MAFYVLLLFSLNKEAYLCPQCSRQMRSNRECEVHMVPGLLEISLTNFRCPTARLFEVWLDLRTHIHKRNLSEPVMFMEGKGTLGLRRWQGHMTLRDRIT